MKVQASSRAYQQTARAEAAEATARRIVEAFLARLMTQWYDEITLERVAEDARVTVQTVVRRFGGKDGLLGQAVPKLAEQINARRTTGTGDVMQIVHRLIADYEATGDAVIRLLALEPRHPALQQVLEFGRSEHRRWVSGAFAEPLSHVDGAVRQRALDALIISTDVYTWKLLRRDLRRSVAETERAMGGLIQAIFVEAHQQTETKTR